MRRRKFSAMTSIANMTIRTFLVYILHLHTSGNNSLRLILQYHVKSLPIFPRAFCKAWHYRLDRAEKSIDQYKLIFTFDKQTNLLDRIFPSRKQNYSLLRKTSTCWTFDYKFLQNKRESISQGRKNRINTLIIVRSTHIFSRTRRKHTCTIDHRVVFSVA